MKADTDLDVMNILKDFKEDDKNAVLYVRYDEEGEGFWFGKLTEDSALNLFYWLLIQGILKYEIMDAVLNQLVNDKQDYQNFVKAYRELKER